MDQTLINRDDRERHQSGGLSIRAGTGLVYKQWALKIHKNIAWFETSAPFMFTEMNIGLEF